MTTHQQNQSQEETDEEPLTDLLRRKGMKKISALMAPDATKESKRKATERARRMQEDGETQINFMMIVGCKATVRAVAAAVRDPQVHSAIAAVATAAANS